MSVTKNLLGRVPIPGRCISECPKKVNNTGIVLGGANRPEEENGNYRVISGYSSFEPSLSCKCFLSHVLC